MKNILKQLIIIISIFSCSKPAEFDWTVSITSTEDMFEAFSNEMQINGEVFIHDSTHLSKPINIKIVKNLLIINDNYGGDLYSIYDVDEKKFLSRFLKKGRGPNEYLGGFSVSIEDYLGDSLMVLNTKNNSVSIFSLKKVEEGDNIPDKIIKLAQDNKNVAIDHCFLFDNVLLTSGMFEKGRFHLYSLLGKDMGFFGEYPKVKYNGKYDNFHLGDKFGSGANFTFNLNTCKMACSNRDMFDIYSFTKENKSIFTINPYLTVQWKVPEFYSATYDINGRAKVISLGSRSNMIGSGYVVSTEKHILFPFSSNSFNEVDMKGLEDWYDYIFVMDWNGNPIARLKLDKRIKFPLEIDSDNNYVYSLHTDIKTTGLRQIIRFNINKLNDL